MSNPLNGLVGGAELEKAKTLVIQYRAGTEPPGTKEEEVHRVLHNLYYTTILQYIYTLRNPCAIYLNY